MEEKWRKIYGVGRLKVWRRERRLPSCSLLPLNIAPVAIACCPTPSFCQYSLHQPPQGTTVASSMPLVVQDPAKLCANQLGFSLGPFKHLPVTSTSAEYPSGHTTSEVWHPPDHASSSEFLYKLYRASLQI